MHRNHLLNKSLIRKTGFWTLCLAWFAMCSTFGPQSAFGQSDANREHHRTAEVMELFQSQTMDVNYVEAPVADIINELSAETGTNFLLHESATDENFDPETLVTLKLKKVRIATVLDRLLAPYQCTWQVQDGIVTLMSEDNALDHLQIKVFNLEEITIRTGADQLTELISETIDPDSWEQNGGNARIYNVNGIVVVTQTNVNLRAIDDFLDRRRESGLMDQ